MPGCAENMNHSNPITEQGLGNALLGALTLDFDSVFVVDCETEEILPVHVSENYQRDVVTASNGVDALKALRKDPEINFVLTDMWMPEMDGQTLVAEIRRNAAWSELPVYAVTADVEARNLGEDSGFTGVLLKPITFEKLKSLFI